MGLVGCASDSPKGSACEDGAVCDDGGPDGRTDGGPCDVEGGRRVEGTECEYVYMCEGGRWILQPYTDECPEFRGPGYDGGSDGGDAGE